MRTPVTPSSIIKVDGNSTQVRDDLLATEEPLEIRIGFGRNESREQVSLAVTMRTPGNDFELALGFLFTEGIIASYSDVSTIHYCETVKPEEKENVVRVELREDVTIQLQKLQRNFYTSSSCGVCGKMSIEMIRSQSRFDLTAWTISAAVIHSLPEKLAGEQTFFEHTGGLHAVALFDSTGTLLTVREDVGRHNAFDKIAGDALIKSKLPLSEKIVLLSGRGSFELIQKSVMAGVSMVVAVGAPSSLAVALAQETNLTLIGFARKKKFNIYSGDHRITFH